MYDELFTRDEKDTELVQELKLRRRLFTRVKHLLTNRLRGKAAEHSYK